MKTKKPVVDKVFKGFVKYWMSKAELAACKASEFPIGDLETTLIHLCESGYKTSVSWDDYSDAFAAYLACNNPQDENYGWCLSGRGSTPVKALKQACYQHFVLFDKVWPKLLEASRAEIDD
jgi:hypothetical protein